MKKYILLLSLFWAFNTTAIELSEDGEGDVLLFPFYTVENNHQSVLSIYNNSPTVKAVKIRFYERFLFRETLDYNLYLAPFDSYQAAVYSGVSTYNNHQGEPTALLTDTDSSCTPFLAAEQQFIPYILDADVDYDRSMDRVQTGGIAIIDMGEVVDPEAQNIIHTNGVPNNCDAIQANWSGGVWDVFSGGDTEYSMASINSGLRAQLLIQDLTNLTSFELLPITFEDSYVAAIYHREPGYLSPDIHSGLKAAVISVYQQWVNYFWPYDVNNMTSMLQNESLETAFELTQSTQSDINIIVTFINKQVYVEGNNFVSGNSPFTSELNVEDQGACEPLLVEVRDEQGMLLDPSFNENFSLCEEVNVIPVVADGESPVMFLDDSYRAMINVGNFTQGTITFKTQASNQIYYENPMNPIDTTYFFGLPMQGFQVMYTDDGVNPPSYQYLPLTTTKRYFNDWIFGSDF